MNNEISVVAVLAGLLCLFVLPSALAMLVAGLAGICGYLCG